MNIKICRICEQLKKIEYSTPTETNTIWGFNPYMYLSFNQMKTAFHFFIIQEYTSSTFYTTYNEEGYTYTQWQIYYLSKNTIKAKKLHKQTLWLFKILSGYPFFKELVKIGTRNDPLHHTLLHFMRYLEKYGPSQQKIVELLEEFSLSLSDIDSSGYSGDYYLLYKIMNKDDIEKCNQLTHEYKVMETELFNNDEIKEQLKYCEICSEPIDKFTDLVNIKNIDKKLITDIIQKRTECNDIYKSYQYDSSVERHQHVIDIYKKIILI